MNAGFHYELAKGHGADLQRDAESVRRARAARQGHHPATLARRRRNWLIGAAVATSLVATGAAYASASGPSAAGRSWTPNACIRLNGGDYNACNVGNSGRGDLPYLPVSGSGRHEVVALDCQPTRLDHYC